jgi:hypothetical protein
MSAVPEGFREIPRPSPFNALVGPLYERRAGKNLSLGLRIEEKHTNLVTVHLPLNCYLVSGGERIVRASAIFARARKER